MLSKISTYLKTLGTCENKLAIGFSTHIHVNRFNFKIIYKFMLVKASQDALCSSSSYFATEM